jgi:hypothetical protein
MNWARTKKFVQRVLRHARSHVTKDRYIKTFDSALVAAIEEARVYG